MVISLLFHDCPFFLTGELLVPKGLLPVDLHHLYTTDKKFYSIIYAVLGTWRSIAVTRSQFLRRLLRDHAQTAAVWQTVAVNL